MPKEEYGSLDAQPVVLYGKEDDLSRRAIPIFVDSGGGLKVSSLSQLVNVNHDEKSFTWTNGDLTQIIYKLNSVVVATVTLTWSNGELTNMAVA